MLYRTINATAFAAALGLALAPMQPASAETAAEFYAKQNLTIIVGFSPGGGGDTFARFFAHHLSNHMAGNPSVIVQNMPGAGGIKALNYLYNAGAKEGSKTMLTSPTHTLAQLLDKPNIRFDLKKMSWIGTLTQDSPSCAASGQSGFKSITETKDREIIMGSTGPSSSTSQHPLLLANMLGYKIRIVSGYRGTARVWLAMKKNEVQSMCTFWASIAMGSRADDVKSGEMVRIIQMGRKKHPAFGNAPWAYDLARNADERAIMRAIFGVSELSRPFGTPPGVPEDRLNALRKGFWAAVTSPELQADAKRLKLTVDPLNAGDTVAALQEIFDTPKHLIANAKKLIGGSEKKKNK
jgi:tripartite-type tricarboxylate transporter receptor subunit TctC